MKGVFWLLAIKPIIILIIIAIAAIAGWWLSIRYPIVCTLAGEFLDQFGLGRFCFWIQFALIMLIGILIVSKI